MLKDYKIPAKEDKQQLKAEIKSLRERLMLQQQMIREQKLPVLVLVEGWSAAGKGSLINEVISEIDPRFYGVAAHPGKAPERDRYPFLYPYVGALPEEGKIMFYDAGWVEETAVAWVRRELTKDEYRRRIREIHEFERQLRDGGYLLVKIFLHIDRKTQARRLLELRKDPDTAWRVTDSDLWQNRQYKVLEEAFDQVLDETDGVFSWHVLDGSRRKQYVRDALKLLVQAVDRGLARGKYVGKPFKEDFPLLQMPKLREVDLSPAIEDEAYQEELDRLQDQLRGLHDKIYRRRIPVVLCYEGWDAAGKGGNIRRVALPLDPRGFQVIPISSPEPHELSRHYLWRFWTRLPKTGHVTIFDRTWYGRVMVERLEGYCSEDDWNRAYNEINEFERQLTEWGAVVLKFWIQIDQDTQLERFHARQNSPEKQWKLTEEDWRNREKWPQYEAAIDEMLEKTSTKNAPWHIIESNDKKYARIKTLKIITEALERACEEHLARG